MSSSCKLYSKQQIFEAFKEWYKLHIESGGEPTETSADDSASYLIHLMDKQEGDDTN